MAHNLVIVESPAKAKRIAGFLGEGWREKELAAYLPETRRPAKRSAAAGAREIAQHHEVK